jgi:hypothetical protein
MENMAQKQQTHFQFFFFFSQTTGRQPRQRVQNEGRELEGLTVLVVIPACQWQI